MTQPPMIRIACATFGFGEQTLESSAKIVRDLGFDLVDVGAAWGKYDQVKPLAAVADPAGQADHLRRVMQEHRLGVSELFVMTFGHNVNDPSVDKRAETQRMFAGLADFAARAGFESIMMLPGPVHEDQGQSPQEAFDLSVAELSTMVRVATDHGIGCNVEPNKGSIAGRVEDAINLCEAVSGLGLTLDYAHQVPLGYSQEQIERLHRYTKHLHAKQVTRDGTQARPDEGDIDFARIIGSLKAGGFDGVICTEFMSRSEQLEAGWDFQKETARLRDVLVEALSG
ncbi:MAG: sugar phosphate isomerase/epimerase [Phycisphaeraceae bacterium]|nr:sugar phosphate isomerase/epimerase [Phycisphaeraceae bacterium]MDP7347232.1 sugar phosphate isomerase/epimerase [Phycisphaeraceae bacterium]